MRRNLDAMHLVSLDTCQVCGAPAQHRHHIVNRSITQCDDPENLAALCHRCHADVHAKSIDLGIYLTRAQSAKAVLLMGTLARAFWHLYPSESPRKVAA